MKTPSEVIASDNSSAVNEMKEWVANCCDEMFKEFEKAVEESCGKFDRSIHILVPLPEDNVSDYYKNEFCSMCKTHFRNMIGEWDNFVNLDIFQTELFKNRPFLTWCADIKVIYDTMKNCFVEVDKNIPPKRQH